MHDLEVPPIPYLSDARLLTRQEHLVAEIADGRRHRQRRRFALGGVGAITIIAFASKLGPEASILATVLIALSVALLNISGLSTEIVGRYVQTGSDLMPKK